MHEYTSRESRSSTCSWEEKGLSSKWKAKAIPFRYYWFRFSYEYLLSFFPPSTGLYFRWRCGSSKIYLTIHLVCINFINLQQFSRLFPPQETLIEKSTGKRLKGMTRQVWVTRASTAVSCFPLVKMTKLSETAKTSINDVIASLTILRSTP